MAQKAPSKLLLISFAVVVALGGVAYWMSTGVISNKLAENGTTATPASASPIPTIAPTPNPTPTPTPDPVLTIDSSALNFDNPGANPSGPLIAHGPYRHRILSATSTDGLQFTSTGSEIVNHASVPDMIKLPSGQLAFYAVDGVFGRSGSGVLVGLSVDGGKTWKFGSIKLDGEGDPISDPQVVLNGNHSLRLYYQTVSRKVNSATSEDGIHFTKEPGTRYSGGSNDLDPDVIQIGSAWYMYLNRNMQEVYATSDSPNGTFTYKGGVGSGAVSKTISLGSGTYRQYFCSMEGGIFNRTSTDGQQWDNKSLSLSYRGSDIICDPSVVQVDPNNWLMLYKLAPLEN